MNTLLDSNNFQEAVEVARSIRHYQFIYYLFINYDIQFSIEDFIEEFDAEFLLGLVRFSC